jgi:hypothetical protein
MIVVTRPTFSRQTIVTCLNLLMTFGFSDVLWTCCLLSRTRLSSMHLSPSLPILTTTNYKLYMGVFLTKWR